ncbi:hypothetical protein [Paenibacillus wulumuqiensis]|uniref:hypothetical protein n=1 Tax=Paenibacillus wulumuqiensis TaxID=1567107 RepID=UPI000619EA17|nr:hypothetical protein [Paenibacillus wulumuqiensis]
MVTADGKTKLVNKRLIRAQQSDGSPTLTAGEPDHTINTAACRYPSCALSETEAYQVISFIEHHQLRLLHYREQRDQLKQYSEQLLREIPTASCLH